MLLGFNIGNTNTTIGLFRDADIAPRATLTYPTEKDITAQQLAFRIEAAAQSLRGETGCDDPIAGFAFSSVAPEVNPAYHAAARVLYDRPALEITHAVKLPIRIAYDTPAELGVDRIVNAAAAYHEHHGDCIIVDLGTAITFCVLRAEGLFDGGLIAPGVGICIDALAARTSRLPRSTFRDPGSPVARNTADAVAGGFYYGWLSLVEGIIGRIKGHYGIDFLVILTGGYAEAFAGSCAFPVTVDRLLTMKGIKLIYDLNS